MQGMDVSKDYFRVMGLTPAEGRGFEDSDFAPGPQRRSCWDMSSGSARLGAIQADYWEDGAHQPLGCDAVVIGVMEPGVRFLPSPGAAKEPNYDVNATVDFWVPAYPRSEISRRSPTGT
jgi:putative ABC transport system permease protein